MKVEYINPFIESVFELFSTMLASKATRGEVGVLSATGTAAHHDIMALIGLSGYTRGMVALSFPAQTAINIVNNLLGTESTTMDDTVSDAIAEVVNIVAGSSKAKFRVEGRPPPRSQPSHGCAGEQLLSGLPCEFDLARGALQQRPGHLCDARDLRIRRRRMKGVTHESTCC